MNCIVKIIIPTLEEIGWSTFDHFGMGFEVGAAPYNKPIRDLGFENDVPVAQIATAVDMVIHSDPTAKPVNGYFALEAKLWKDELKDEYEKKVQVYARALGLSIAVLSNGWEWRVFRQKDIIEHCFLEPGDTDAFIGKVNSVSGREKLTRHADGKVLDQSVLNIGYSRK